MTQVDHPTVGRTAGPAVHSANTISGASWQKDLGGLLRLAAPNVANMGAESLMSFVDFVIVSQIGAAAQAAVSTGSLVYLSAFGFGLGILACVTTVVSQSLGAGRRRDCAAYGWQGVWLGLAYGLLGIALWPWVDDLYAFIGHEPVVQAMETGYTRIRLAGMGLSGAAVALGHFFNGIHRPQHNAYSVVATTVLNGVLAYALVLGKWDLPAMGVAGAAWSTVIALLVRVVWLLVVMNVGRVATEFQARGAVRLSLEKMGKLIRVGWPSGLNMIVDLSAWTVLMAWVIGQFGTLHLAAASAVWRLTELSFMPAIGLGHAVATMVGRAMGEGRPQDARRRARLGLAINMTYMGLMAVIFVVCGGPLMRLFADQPEVVRLGVELLVLAAIFQLFDAMAITFINALRGAGDTLWPALVIGAQVWGLMIGGAVLVAKLMPQWGARGPWGAATLFVIVVGLTMAWRWRRGAWERLDVIGRNEAIEPLAASPETGTNAPTP